LKKPKKSRKYRFFKSVEKLYKGVDHMHKDKPGEGKVVKKKKEYEKPVLSKYHQLKKVVACPD